MRVILVGPSLAGDIPRSDGIAFWGPARQGDIAFAVDEGASVIGLVDGYFGAVASTWHKEILYALSAGVSVFGSSSMGALRAAECQAFGMKPIGIIALAYCSGALQDDAAVALTSMPAELGHFPLVEPLVDVWPTLQAMLDADEISRREYLRLMSEASRIFFADRTIAELIRRGVSPGRQVCVMSSYHRLHVAQKRLDALTLVQAVLMSPDRRQDSTSTFTSSPFWLDSNPGRPAMSVKTD